MLNYILFLNDRISIFYKVLSILSLEYFVCFFFQRPGGVPGWRLDALKDEAEEKEKIAEEEK